MKYFLLVLFIAFTFASSNISFAASKEDLFFDTNNTKFVPSSPVVDQKVKVYLRLKNTANEDIKGVVRGFNLTDGKKIQIEQPFTTIAYGKADVFFEFIPKKSGVQELKFRLIPWGIPQKNDTSTDRIIAKIFVDVDTDSDGIGNQQDSDDDNDGVNDSVDIFPLDKNESQDSDNDGKGDNTDTDDDNDGVKDNNDAFPFDAQESSDTDGDGIGDNADTDDDGDNLTDEGEKNRGTDPKNPDTDGDKTNDDIDVFPLDDRYQLDTDLDGIPNKKDTDDDNDGFTDRKDVFPLDKNEWKDSDTDGVGDRADLDDDNDKLTDTEEIEKGSDPLNPDTDGDGVKDGNDAFVLDPTETLDSDNDGLGDNTDTNNHNKGPVIVLPPHKVLEIGRNEIFSITANTSYDPEGGGLSFLWQVVGENGNIIKSKNGADFKAIFPSIGEQKIRLIVTDEADESRTQEFVLHIYLSSRDIILGIIGFGVLNILGIATWWWRRRKKKTMVR